MPGPDFLDTNVLVYAYDSSNPAKQHIAQDLSAILDALGPIKAIAPDGDTVRRAVEAHAQYGVHFYDGMILAAAERGACARILSDLNAGQGYFGVKVENPFA
jgi:predicted nucleic acid-binding protein